MELTEKQISKIQEYVNRDGIFYADICHEMTDHIAATLEERLEKEDVGFEAALKEYMNSHQKVKLLTAAKEQQKIKDGVYRNYFFKLFITGKGIVAFLLILTGFYLLSAIDYVIVDTLNIIFNLLVLWTLVGRHYFKFKGANTFLIHFYKETMLYYLIPVLFLQLRRFFKEEEWFLWANLFTIALCYTGIYALYLTNKHYLNKKYA